MPRPTALPTNVTSGTPGHLSHTNAVHAAVNGLTLVRHSVKTGPHTLVLSDSAEVVEVNSANATTVTVPTSAQVAFPVGTVIMVCQLGGGRVTLVPGTGVTLRSASSLSTRTRYSEVSLRKRGRDEWLVSGDLS